MAGSSSRWVRIYLKGGATIEISEVIAWNQMRKDGKPSWWNEGSNKTYVESADGESAAVWNDQVAALVWGPGVQDAEKRALGFG